MVADASIQFIIRLISEKHESLVKSGDILFEVLAGENAEAKKSAAISMLQTANDLKAILSTNDIPPWLLATTSHLAAFIDGRWNSFNFLQHFIQTKSAINTHRWIFNESSEVAFDFDSIFDHFKKESRLPELFDEIIRLLEDIQNSGAVDSVTMLRTLGKVTATIKRCKDGSYLSLNSAWEFLLSFLNNYMWGELSKLPVLGTALEALRKTIAETNEEMSQLHIQIQGEMKRVVGEEIKVLANKSVFPFVTYDKTGHSLQSSAVRQLPEQTA